MSCWDFSLVCCSRSPAASRGEARALGSLRATYSETRRDNGGSGFRNDRVPLPQACISGPAYNRLRKKGSSGQQFNKIVPLQRQMYAYINRMWMLPLRPTYYQWKNGTESLCNKELTAWMLFRRTGTVAWNPMQQRLDSFHIYWNSKCWLLSVPCTIYIYTVIGSICHGGHAFIFLSLGPFCPFFTF